MKKTLVLGASNNPQRYSYLATERLLNAGHEVIPIGLQPGVLHGLEILTDHPALEGIDTVTMYIGPQNQPQYYDYLLGLKPKRIIFNPGTENPELEKMAADKGIEAIEACTLVMLSINSY